MIKLIYRIHLTYSDAGDFYEISINEVWVNDKELDLSYDSIKINSIFKAIGGGYVYSQGINERFCLGPAIIDLSEYKDGNYIEVEFSSEEIRRFQRDGGPICKQSEIIIEDGIKSLVEEKGRKEAMARVQAILDRITVMSVMEA